MMVNMKKRMGRPEADKDQIIDVLKKAYPMDLTQTEIADRCGLHRHTVRKYLNEFIRNGKVTVSREKGVWKFYKLKRK
jgi:DNA-binding IclR family transcriptional regulator